ncbi:MAG: thioesterase family protein [Candidatus Kapabacteria bacterium]|nr:thioesterase family protein [Candidatus Kapabacteria bacterium]
MAAAIVFNSQYRVRYSDTDKMGVVYYGNYMRLFEIGRTELLRAAGLPYIELEHDGFLLPVLEAHAEYLSPARYDDVLVIATSYTMEYSPIIVLVYEIKKSDITLVRGWTRHSFVRAGDFKPVRPPQRFFDAMEAYNNRADS